VSKVEDSIAVSDVQMKFSLLVFVCFIKEGTTVLIPAHPIIILFCLAIFYRHSTHALIAAEKAVR
jgi:hypothetical protein